MIYPYCASCKCRVWSEKDLIDKPYRQTCSSPNSHRASRDIKSRSDFKVGGRRSKRLRANFDTVELAKDYERNTKADFKRGKYFPWQQTVTFSELADKYYNEHVLIHSHDHKRTSYYRIQMAKELFKGQLVGEITRQQVRELRPKLQQQKVWTGATTNRFIGGVLCPIFNKGIEWDLVKENPCTHLTRMEEKDPIPRFLTQEEIGRLFDAIQSDVLRDYANIILHTGARPSSIERCSFDSGDVDLTNRIIWFTTYKGRKKHRYPHPVDDTLYEILLRRVVDTRGKGKVFDTTNVRTLSVEAIKKSQINQDKNADQEFTIYGLKHSYASYLLMQGATLFDVAKLLGHTDIKMLQKHYGHLTLDHLRIVQAKLNSIPAIKLRSASHSDI